MKAKRCLFAEGPSGCGKTMSILRSLGPVLPKAGGFATCRLRREDQSLYGFCQCEPGELKTVDRQIIPGIEHIFLRTGAKQGVSFGVFRGYTLERLREGLSAPFCVLDEIGGAELLIPEFTEALFTLIDSGNPIIGVWKNEKNSRRMAEKCMLGDAYSKVYTAVRKKLTDNPGVTLMYIERGDDRVWQSAIEGWTAEFLLKDREADADVGFI